LKAAEQARQDGTDGVVQREMQVARHLPCWLTSRASIQIIAFSRMTFASGSVGHASRDLAKYPLNYSELAEKRKAYRYDG